MTSKLTGPHMTVRHHVAKRPAGSKINYRISLRIQCASMEFRPGESVTAPQLSDVVRITAARIFA